jgi:hypothetical protein
MAPEEKVAAISAAADEAFANGPYVIMTTYGEVQMTQVVAATDGVAVWASVWQGIPPQGDPGYVFVNPPSLAPDPSGEYLLDGQRYSYDLIAALAWSVGANGGARGTGKNKGHRSQA